ncbi:putative E3 ubiquitin ligase [Phytophthora cinnamomi]|uniref:putative E3 ubiquitin ligase n=1 Tax=Phytophthora cinnamomi TaxID=4785 RepID=UPI003559C5EC|nr:putative E3 ubiquitin ligase [Phytophthora cinnamomi]
MVTRKRTRHGVRNAGRASGRSTSLKLKGLLNVGDWLDVLDLDGVWNVARVLSVPAPGEVEITYDGWPTDYDEVVRIDSDRVAPYHTFTKAVKCWVKYLNWPLWPSLITIRTPGTPQGVRNLMAENRLHVDFLDNPDFSKRDRCWQKKGQARAFESNFDTKRMATTGAQFERALVWVLQSDASSKMPRFVVGTLPVEYKNGEMESVQTARRNMGDELWFQNFTQNRMHHRLCHVYETTGEEEKGDSSSDESPPRKLNVRRLNLSAMKQELPLIGKEKKQPPPVKIELDPYSDPEVPYELVPMSGSDSGSSPEKIVSASKMDIADDNAVTGGQVHVDEVDKAEAKSTSAVVSVDEVDKAEAKSTSAVVSVDEVDKAEAKSTSAVVSVDEVDKAEAQPTSAVVSVDSSDLVSTIVIDRSEKGSQELRGRFCMMQTAKQESSSAVHAEEKVKRSRQTVIASRQISFKD